MIAGYLTGKMDAQTTFDPKTDCRADGEGAEYQNMLGVLVLSEQLFEPVPGIMETIDTAEKRMA